MQKKSTFLLQTKNTVFTPYAWYYHSYTRMEEVSKALREKYDAMSYLYEAVMKHIDGLPRYRIPQARCDSPPDGIDPPPVFVKRTLIQWRLSKEMSCGPR
eukprot:TRINITY_DN10242_c0_g1::TRINITY_DN10242_c0_g1_i1::g.7002::m.7002 TRINITY_DN10242_c0_g1::TRINITY_DN10242_c0_g1_i1::g.7002  ORF type:complete len:100 (-),score=4.08 TRINITY_DN10242_c0_g1_i1:343-642(-)